MNCSDKHTQRKAGPLVKIVNVKITPIAIPDVPLLNTKGVHPHVFLRAIIEVETDTGLQKVAPTHEGLDPHGYKSLKLKGGRLTFKDGTLRVPEGPGLGVQPDHDAVAELHAIYNEQMVTDCDDTDEMLKYVPDYVRKVPRWCGNRSTGIAFRGSLS